MQFQQATDEFLTYLHVEQNCSPHTIRAYAYDLDCFQQFLKNQRSLLTDKTAADVFNNPISY